MAIVNRNRISFGVGIVDFMAPGLNVDFFAGGMFRETEPIGPDNTVRVAGYWIGTGLTWIFGSGSKCCATTSECCCGQ